jgi:long-subunit fatty acid transport protein
MGAAQVASPNNLTALWYNPAGLAALDQVTLQLDFRLTWHRVGFQRLDASGANPENFARVQNGGGLNLTSAAPTGGVSIPIRSLPIPFNVSLGGFPFNGATGYSYPDPRALFANGETAREVEQHAPQRYSSILSASKIYVGAFAVSARPLPWLDLGAELQLANASFSSTQSVSAGVAPGEYADLDAVLQISGRDYFRVSGSFGLTARLPDDLVFGMSYQLPYRFHASGSLTAYVPRTLQAIGATLEGSDATLSLTLPWYFRAGLRLRKPAYEIELATTVDGWSTLDNIRIDTQGVFVSVAGKKTQLPELILPQKMSNAVSVRLGAEWHLSEFYRQLEGLTVRCGALVETTAVPDYRQSISLPNWGRGSLSVGATQQLGRFAIALAYAHFIQPDRDIRDSQVKQVVALPGTSATIVGNGDYSSQLDLFSLSISTRL